MTYFFFLSIILFFIGLFGCLLKRNLISILLCIEVMIASVNLLFVLFSKSTGNLDSQILVLFVVLVTATEAAIGLTLIVNLFRKIKSVAIENIIIDSD